MAYAENSIDFSSQFRNKYDDLMFSDACSFYFNLKSISIQDCEQTLGNLSISKVFNSYEICLFFI